MLNLVKGLALVSAVAFLSACGSNTMSSAFKNVSVSSVDQNGEVQVTLKTEVGGQNLIFSAASLPIVDPKTGKVYGSIAMERTLDGKNILNVSANVKAIKLGNVLPDNKLPNGAHVPIAGLASLVAVPAGQNSRVYLGTTTSGDTMVLGVAIAIKEFDSIASYVPGAVVFLDLGADSSLKGVGGIFTSAESGKSGIGLFVQTNVPNIGIPGISSKALASASTSSSVKFIERAPSRTESHYMGYYLNRWSQKKTQLKMK